MKRHLVIVFVSVLLQMRGWTQDSQYALTLVKPFNSQESVVHTLETETIDLFVIASIDEQPFWDFNTGNLKAVEVVRGDTLELPIIFQGRIRDSLRFGSASVYQIQTRSSRDYHSEKRQYQLLWFKPGQPGQKPILAAKAEAQRDWGIITSFNLNTPFSFPDLLVIGLLLVALFLVALSEGIPFLQMWFFQAKYVTPYYKVQKAGERRLNPITGQQIQPGEKVVKMCDQEFCCVPYSVWKRKGYQCWNYPEKCQGTANLGFRKFFLQLNWFRRLNWLWFGVAGGFFAWLLSYLLSLAPLPPAWFHESYTIVVTGLGLGFGLTSMLALVEELGQGRTLSLVRILLRTGIGLVSAGILFFLSTKLETGTLNTAIFWLVFCTVLGSVISINSSIGVQRGLIGGFLAGLSSTLVYMLVVFFFPKDLSAELAKMVTFMAAGGVLGIGIIQVVKQFSKVEMEVVSPSERRGMVFSLDNFLRAGEQVIIGRDMKGSKVRVKWDDNLVLPHHAVLTMTNNQVFIQPLKNAEIWVDDAPILQQQSRLLKGGEVIRLGRNSISAFKYLQK